MSSVTKIVFVLMLINHIEATSDTESFLQRILPQFSRCWYITSDSGNFNSFIYKSFNQILNPIYSFDHANVSAASVKYCDGYIYIFRSRESLSEFLKHKTNVGFLVNTKIIVFYFGNEGYNFPAGFFEGIHKRAINVIYVRFFKSKRTIFPNYKPSDPATLVCYILAPFIQKELKISISDNINDTNIIGTLFDLQTWRPNFQTNFNTTFRISLFNCPPFIIRKETSFGGLEYKMIQEVTKGWKVELNDRTFVKATVDPWTDSKNDLITRTSDLATCSIWMVYDKWLMFDMTRPYASVCTTFLVPKPVVVSPEKYLYLPLSGKVWIGFVLSVLTSSGMLYAVNRLGLKFLNTRWKDSEFVDLVACVLEITAVATSHGVSTFPKQLVLRYIVMSWILLCFILGASYSTGVASLFTTKRYTRKLETFKDMYEDKDLYWGHYYMNGLGSNLRQSSIPFAREFLEREKIETTSDNIVNRVKTNNYAVVCKVLNKKYVTGTDAIRNMSSRLMLIKECAATFFTVLGLQKNSPYLKLFNKKIMRINEAGLMHHWLSKEVPFKERKYMNQFFIHHDGLVGELLALKVSDLRGPFNLLIIGCLCSMLIFIFEHVLGYKCRRSRNRAENKSPLPLKYRNHSREKQ